MKLKINNFAKIKEADVIIDGITVIAGENNTGKSTVGKILFSLFNSLSNVDEKIFEERLKEIEHTNIMVIQNSIVEADVSRSMVFRSALNISRKIDSQIRKEIGLNGIISDKGLFDIIGLKCVGKIVYLFHTLEPQLHAFSPLFATSVLPS